MKNQIEKDFKGIWIPAEIWSNDGLTLQEKVFLVKILSLNKKDGCYATNEYFSNFFKISKTRVSLVIKSLVQKKYIKSKIIYKKGTKQIQKRVLNNLIYKENDTFQQAVVIPQGDLHKELMKIYFDYVQNRTTVKPKITAAEAKALKSIREYLLKQCDNDASKVELSWKVILDKLKKCDKYYYNNFQLTALNRNLVQIIDQIRNADGINEQQKRNEALESFTLD